MVRLHVSGLSSSEYCYILKRSLIYLLRGHEPGGVSNLPSAAMLG